MSLKNYITRGQNLNLYTKMTTTENTEIDETQFVEDNSEETSENTPETPEAKPEMTDAEKQVKTAKIQRAKAKKAEKEAKTELESIKAELNEIKGGLQEQSEKSFFDTNGIKNSEAQAYLKETAEKTGTPLSELYANDFVKNKVETLASQEASEVAVPGSSGTSGQSVTRDGAYYVAKGTPIDKVPQEHLNDYIDDLAKQELM